MQKFRLFFIVYVCLMFSVTMLAQEIDTKAIESREAEIANIKAALDGDLINYTKGRDRLRELRDMARLEIERFESVKKDLESQLETIGVPPEEGVDEPKEVSKRRIQLKSEIVKVNAGIAQATLNAADSSQLLEEISIDKRNAFVNNLVEKTDNIFSTTRWTESFSVLSSSAGKVKTYYSDWNSQALKNDTFLTKLASLFGMALCLILLYGPIRLKINSKLRHLLKERAFDEHSRYGSMLIGLCIRFIGALLAGFIILWVFGLTGLISSELITNFQLIWYLILALLVSDGVILIILSPENSIHRQIPLKASISKNTRKLGLIAVASVLVCYYMTVVNQDNEGLQYVSEIFIIISTGIVGFILQLFVIRNPLEDEALLSDTKEQVTESNNFQKLMKLFKLMSIPILIIMVFSVTAGYLNLAQFLTSRLVYLSVLFASLWVMRLLAMQGIAWLQNKTSGAERLKDNEYKNSVKFWAGLIVDFILLFATIPFGLLIMGVESGEVKARIIELFKGFDIGNMTISLADVFLSIATFIVIMLVTKILQKVLDNRFFKNTGADAGFRNSFKTLLGYAGLILAVFAAISVFGFNLSSLAIIAGALSVGIGFGLQSIVNNFVSGLILLFERPVKVGDWVVTSSGEGHIKRISVRSTEIETFNLASVIIPNSELISSSVQNWTHKNTRGRIVIPVGVSYDSNMNQVRDLLLQCAAEHEGILKYPAPSVYFEDFGASSLDVELRFFVRNIPDGIPIKSEMRFTILEVFRKHNIEIPFPQRDVHMINNTPAPEE